MGSEDTDTSIKLSVEADADVEVARPVPSHGPTRDHTTARFW